MDDIFLTRSQGQASPAARAQGCQGGRSDLRAPSSRDVRATTFESPVASSRQIRLALKNICCCAVSYMPSC